MKAQLTFGFDVPDVQPTREVRYAGGRCFPYTIAPSYPGLDVDQVHAVLNLVEDAIRYNITPSPILVFERVRGAGGNGPVGHNDWMFRGANGAESYRHNVTVKWPQLIAMLQERATLESGIAHARNLAEAYHLLDYYQGAYLNHGKGRGFGWSGDWSPDPLLDGLRDAVVELGGTVPADLKVRAADVPPPEPVEPYRPDPQLTLHMAYGCAA